MTRICVVCKKEFKSDKPYKICKGCSITKIINGDVKEAIKKHKKVIENLSLKE